MKRQTLNVYSSVKQNFSDLKQGLGLNESETIAYLIKLHELYADKLTKVQHDQIIKDVADMHNQSVL